MPEEKLRQLDLNLLVTFDALLRHCNVSRAAEQLDVSQSAVSHALAKLRLLFRDPLFINTRNVMIPTPKAHEVSGTVFQIVALARTALLSEAPFDAAVTERTINLCLDDVGELTILPELLARLRTLAPRCSVRTLPAASTNLEKVIESGEADLGCVGRSRRRVRSCSRSCSMSRSS